MFLKTHIKKVDTYEELNNLIKDGYMVKASWCRSADCEEKIKEKTSASIRLISFDKEKITGKCVYCKKEAKEIVYIAKAY